MAAVPNGGLIEWPDDRELAARARARAAHRRRRVRLRRHGGAARGRGLGSALRGLLDRDALAARGLPAGHARPRGARGDGRARHPGRESHRARLRRAHVPRPAAGHPRVAGGALGRVARPTSSSSRPCTTSTRTTRPLPTRACGRSNERPCSATRSRGTTSTSRTGATSRSRSATWSARSPRSRCYASQQHRRYADGDYIWHLARVHGTNVNRDFAEVFQARRSGTACRTGPDTCPARRSRSRRSRSRRGRRGGRGKSTAPLRRLDEHVRARPPSQTSSASTRRCTSRSTLFRCRYGIRSVVPRMKATGRRPRYAWWPTSRQRPIRSSTSVEQALDLRLVLDMCLGVRVQRPAVARAGGTSAIAVRVSDELPPPAVVELGRASGSPVKRFV